MERGLEPVGEADLAELTAMGREAFRQALDGSLWRMHGRTLRRSGGGAIEAAACAVPVGQLIGGRSVPAAAVGGVMVGPTVRGRGRGRALMHELLREVAGAGASLATLYPSTMRFYRNLGFEAAGARVRFAAPLAALEATVSAGSLEAWDEHAIEEISECYHAMATASSGLLDRSRSWWNEAVPADPGDGALHRYAVRGADRVTGYVSYVQAPITGGSPHAYEIACHDLVWTDRESMEALLDFFARQRILASAVSWWGPVDDPLTVCFAPHAVSARRLDLTMTRIVDVRGALEARGYSKSATGGVALAIEDPLLPDNARALQIEFADGRARTHPLDDAVATIDVGALGSLYTGWRSARELERLDRIRGAADGDLDVLDAAFAGPKPWLLDYF